MIPFRGGEAGTFAADVPGFLDTSLAAWLDALRSGSEGIAAGSTAAFSLASAAALTGMAARRGAAEWDEAAGAAAQAEALCARALELMEENALAFRQARAALDGRGDLPADLRDVTLGGLLSRAAQAPARIAELAADVTVLAAEAARRGHPDARPDAAAAALMAAGCARAAAHLVGVNLAAGGGDPLAGRAAAAAARAAGTAESVALAAG